MKITGAVLVNSNGTSATSAVTITSIDINGSMVYISYVDGSGNLRASNAYLTSAGILLATGCTVSS